jgi:hypothetical protein
MNLVLPIFFLGLLASLSPATIIVFILLLGTTRARVNGVAFLIGWTVSLTVVFAAGYVIGGDRATQHGGGRIVVNIIEIIVGVALIVAGASKWRQRHQPRSPSGISKSLTNRLKLLRPWEAAVLGVLKEPWTLTVAAAVVIVRQDRAAIAVLVAFVVFTVISTATVGATFWYYARHPDRADVRLSAVRVRLVGAGPVMFAVASSVVGLYLIIDGLGATLG